MATKKYTLSFDERETTIVKVRDEDYWEIYTCDDTIQTKCRKAGYEPCKRNDSHRPPGLWFKVPEWCICFRRPERQKRTLSAKQTEAARERGRKLSKSRRKLIQS